MFQSCSLRRFNDDSVLSRCTEDICLPSMLKESDDHIKDGLEGVLTLQELWRQAHRVRL